MGKPIGGYTAAIVVAAILIAASLFFVLRDGGDDPVEDEDPTISIDVVNSEMKKYSTGLIGHRTSGHLILSLINETHHKINNTIDGYSIVLPKAWDIDDKDIEFAVHFRDEGLKLSIMRQVLNTSFERSVNYLGYSYDNIRKDYGPIDHKQDETVSFGNRTFESISFQRERIDTIDEDLDHYTHFHHVVDEGIIFSFLLKTIHSQKDNTRDIVEEALSSFDFWDVELYEETTDPPPTSIDGIYLEGGSMDISIDRGSKVMGIYHAVHQDYWGEVADLENGIDLEFDLFMDYVSFNDEFDDVSDYIHNHYSQGHVVLLTFQPFRTAHGEDFVGDVLLFDMLCGDYDQFIIEWAQGLKDLGEPFFLRFGNEMNGDWTQWCAWFYGLDPDLYIMAWSRMYSIFEQVGADNVIMVWNPHDRTYPSYDWHAPCLYYPGDDLVDWIGLTAYNNGVTRPTEVWRDFEVCYSDLYDDYMRRYSSKPFMITEFACNEIGGDKAQWITDGISSLLLDYPNIWMAVWWNGVDETWLYDIDSTEESLEAFRDAIKDDAVATDAVTRK